MKKIISLIFVFVFITLIKNDVHSQALKVGVFDLDLMVQAMPGYQTVDSLMQIYDRDSLGAEEEYNQMEYKRLDSVYRVDSAAVANGQKSKPIYDMVVADRQKAMVNILYWQQIAQNKSAQKRSFYAQNLYKLASDAYRKVLARKKYTLILKPNTYEVGFNIENVFIAVARELKMNELPQELIYLGADPDPVKPATQKPPATKPKS